MMVDCAWQKDPFGNDGHPFPAGSMPRTKGRVLHVVNGEHYAGAERVQDLLGGALPWFGYEVGIACVKPGQFSQTRKNKNVPLFECWMGGRFDLRPVRPVVHLMRERRYNLLHAHTPRSLMIASVVSLLTRVPLIYHIHSPAMSDTTDRFRNWINASLERMGLASASHLIAVSDSLRERYLRLGFSSSRVTVVSNGVPCDGSLPLQPHSSGYPMVFGIVALFRPRKGLEVLLRAMADLRALGKVFRLRAIGQFETSDYERHVKTLAKELGVNGMIDWVGFSSKIDRELTRIDCLVLPSLFGEGLPMVILEAMACGRPVIATDVEGTPEAIRHGENGLLAKPNDPSSLAEMMSRVIDRSVDMHTLALRAIQDQREHFSVCSMASGVAKVYDRVWGGQQNHPSRDCRNTPCVALATGSKSVSKICSPMPVDGLTANPELPV